MQATGDNCCTYLRQAQTHKYINAQTYTGLVPTTAQPTSVPTGAPLIVSTLGPTYQPSTTPSHTPTSIPAQFPTSIRVYQVKMAFYAIFSDDFRYITVDINLTDSMNNDDDVDISLNWLVSDCSDIFTNDTIQLLSSQANCDVEETKIVIELSGYSTLLINDSLFIKEQAFEIKTTIANASVYDVVNLTITNIQEQSDQRLEIASIKTGNNPIVPNIVISQFQQTIGICSDVTLDARNTGNLGGRSGVFKWFVQFVNINNNHSSNDNNSMELYGKYVTIPNNYISIDTVELRINLVVSTWYNGNSTILLSVTVNHESIASNNTIIPTVWTVGPHVFTIEESINNNENGIVTIAPYFTVVSNISCLLSKLDLNITDVGDVEYATKWNVTNVTAFAGDSYNYLALQNLNDYLESVSASESLILDMTDMEMGLIPGYVYQFDLFFDCNLQLTDLITLDCESTVVSHRLRYDYSDLKCQIVGGETKTISNVSISQLDGHSLSLDGNTFSYDPQFYQNIQNKSHLEFVWSCTRYDIKTKYDNGDFMYDNVTNCTHLLEADSNVAGKTALDFNSNITDDFTTDTIIYVFELTVKDSTNNHRKACQTEQTLLLDNILINDSSYDEVKLLDVSLTALKTHLNENDRLRLIVNINNANSVDFENSKENYEFVYSEENGYFTSDELNSMSGHINDSNNHNLILESNTLSKDVSSYLFSVTAFYIGVSPQVQVGYSSINIFVNQGPKIVDGSFDSSGGNCTNVVLNTFADLFDLTFDLSVEANGDDIPLLYQFSYIFEGTENKTKFLHSSLLSDSFLDDVLLPIGNYSLQASVFDASGASDSRIMQEICTTVIASSNIEFCEDIDNITKVIEDQLDRYNRLPQAKKYFKNFQIFEAALGYLATYTNVKCHIDITQVLHDILQLIANEFGSVHANLCQTGYVAELGQLMTMWFEVYFSSVKNTDSLAWNSTGAGIRMSPDVYDILLQVLDPCDIYGEQSVEYEMSVVVDSIITQHALIYYHNDDVTNDISHVLTNVQDIQLESFYNLMIATVKYINQVNRDMIYYNDKQYHGYISKVSMLVYNSLVISELVLISVAIPSETTQNTIKNQIWTLKNNDLCFDLFSTRLHNELMSANLGKHNTRMSLTKDDTKQGRFDFDSYFPALNSMDIIVIIVDNVNYNETSNETFPTHNNISYSGTDAFNVSVNDTLGIVSDRVFIRMISNHSNLNSTQLYPLNNNLTIKFITQIGTNNISNSTTNNNSYGDIDYQGTFKCVWYQGIDSNDDTKEIEWNDQGCVASVFVSDNDPSLISVSCNCNHMTTFAILYHLHDDSVNDNEDTMIIFEEYLDHVGYVYLLGILMFGFGIVTIYGIFLLCQLRMYKFKMCKFASGKYWCTDYEPVFASIWMIMLNAMANFISCLLLITFVTQFEVNDNSNNKDNNEYVDFFVTLVTFSLFLPLILSFYIFSNLIYTLSMIAKALSASVLSIQQRILQLILYTDIFITIILICIALAFALNDVTDVVSSIPFVFCQSIYFILLFIVLVSTIYYCIKAYKVISESIRHLNQDNHINAANGKSVGSLAVDTSSELKSRNRMVLTTIIIAIFLLFQMVITVVCAIDPFILTPPLHLFELLLFWIYLALLLYLYRNYVNYKVLSEKSKQKDKFKNKSMVRSGTVTPRSRKASFGYLSKRKESSGNSNNSSPRPAVKYGDTAIGSIGEGNIHYNEPGELECGEENNGNIDDIEIDNPDTKVECRHSIKIISGTPVPNEANINEVNHNGSINTNQKNSVKMGMDMGVGMQTNDNIDAAINYLIGENGSNGNNDNGGFIMWNNKDSEYGMTVRTNTNTRTNTPNLNPTALNHSEISEDMSVVGLRSNTNLAESGGGLRIGNGSFESSNGDEGINMANKRIQMQQIRKGSGLQQESIEEPNENNKLKPIEIVSYDD